MYRIDGEIRGCEEVGQSGVGRFVGKLSGVVSWLVRERAGVAQWSSGPEGP